MLNRQAAIQKMNQLGRVKLPFLFVISFDQESNLVIEYQKTDKTKILFKTFRNNNIQNQTQPHLPEWIDFKKFPVAFSHYKKAFEIVKDNLRHGNTYLVNLTFPAFLEMNLDLKQIFFHSDAPYKLWIKEKLVVFSPETFVRIENGKISSFPMKGTIDAAVHNAHEAILNDPKETAEHNTIVDLIRNDLSIISKNVYVKRYRYIERVKTNQKDLLQVSSEVVGNIPEDFFDFLGDNFFRILPAGSISGAPKKKTLEIINDAEPYERGFYTGIFGFYDGESDDSAVMIRYIENSEGRFIFKSGGGITAFSDVRKEYEELIDKIYVPITGNNKS